MTDEEKLAEEYVKSVIDVNAFDWKIVREIALAFLAGLKAGSQLDKVWHDYDAGEDCYEDSHEGKWVKRETSEPKWHDVAGGDLPKENKLYLVTIKDNGLAIAYFNSRHWETKYNLGDFGHCVETVIAWCEIPQYTKE